MLTGVATALRALSDGVEVITVEEATFWTAVPLVGTLVDSIVVASEISD